jgi:hypothetical protein
MAEETTVAETQADEVTLPQVGTTITTSQADASTNSIDDLPEWARKELKDTRKELAKIRIAERDRTQAEMSELQRTAAHRDELLTRASDLERELRSFKARDVLREAGAMHPDLLTDKLSDDALNGDARKRNSEIEALRKAYPGLFRVGSADGGAGHDAGAAAPTGSLGSFFKGKGLT